MLFLCRLCQKYSKTLMKGGRPLSSSHHPKISNLLVRIKQIVSKRPNTCNGVLGGILMASGDFFQQAYFNKGSIKWKEVMSFAMLGVIFGSISITWYKYLEIWFPGISTQSIVKKLLIDEVCWGPLYTTTIFFLLPLAESWDLNFAVKELQSKFITAWLGSAVISLMFQYVNFRFVPLHARVLYSLSTELMYDTAISVYRYQY